MCCGDRSRIGRQKKSMRNHIFIIIGLVGVKLNEPYIDTLPTDDDDESIQLGDDEFFVILDNRNDLYADRDVITPDLLVGKAVATCRAGLVVQCEEIEAVNYGYD
jgi:hypothetical protein